MHRLSGVVNDEAARLTRTGLKLLDRWEDITRRAHHGHQGRRRKGRHDVSKAEESSSSHRHEEVHTNEYRVAEGEVDEALLDFSAEIHGTSGQSGTVYRPPETGQSPVGGRQCYNCSHP